MTRDIGNQTLRIKSINFHRNESQQHLIHFFFLLIAVSSFNTEENNKRNDIMLCDQSPKSQEGTLNYNIGYSKHWKQHIVTGMRLSCCDITIVSGTYNQGHFPSISVMRDVKGNFGVAEIHFGRRPEDVLTSHDRDQESASRSTQFPNAGCGVAELYSGLVLNSFPIPTIPN